MSFRTNRETRTVFPVRSEAEISATVQSRRATSGKKQFQRFLEDKASQATNPEFNKEYSGWRNVDTWNTNLILSNDQRSYRWLREWHKSWEKKKKSGRFSREQAEYAVWKYMVPAAQGKGMARSWRAGITYDETFRPYQERDFVGDDRIDRANVDYGQIVDAIMEEED